jgi:hypothetical protein
MRLVYMFLGMVTFWSVFLTIIFRLEKRMAWPYSELQPAPPFPDPTGYGAARVADAVKNGFSKVQNIASATPCSSRRTEMSSPSSA